MSQAVLYCNSFLTLFLLKLISRNIALITSKSNLLSTYTEEVKKEIIKKREIIKGNHKGNHINHFFCNFMVLKYLLNFSKSLNKFNKNLHNHSNSN